MSPVHSPPRRRNIARAAAALGLVIPLVASASAQATWSDTAPTKDYHCGAVINAPHTPPVSFQSCVLVHADPRGAYVQGAVRVTNTNDNPRRLTRPASYTRVWLNNKFHTSDHCGAATIAGTKTKWCYGKTTFIAGHGHDVFATGYVWAGRGTRDRLHSPHWKTAAPPVQDARARIVSILLREAANPARNREFGAADCNFYTGALGVGSDRGCPRGYRRQAWCADFGRWVWREAGVKTTYLTARAKSFRTYGERLRTWHGGQSLAGVQLGDALVLTRGGDLGHVAFVTAVNRDRSVTTISGNSSDRVEKVTYRPGHAKLLGFSSPVA